MVKTKGQSEAVDEEEGHKSHKPPVLKIQSSTDDPEQLGDDFEDCPWTPPSIEKAIQCSKNEIVGGGTASILTSNIEELEGCGVGLALYFTFIRRTICLLFVLTLLSLPSMYVSYKGSRVPEELHDSGSFYMFNIANIGAANGSAGLTCESLIFTGLEFYLGNSTVESNSTLLMDQCLTLYGIDLPMRDVSAILSALEFLSCIVLVHYIRTMASTTKAVTQRMDDSQLTSTDFAVMVRGLPLNVTEDAVLAHFNDLYRLDVEDWKKRPVIAGAGPVTDSSNTGNAKHEGTYIAEVVILRRVGGLIRKFRKREKALNDLQKTRAQYKMRHLTSPIAALRNSRLAEKHLRKSEDLAIGMENMTSELADTINYDPDRGFISYTEGIDQSDCIAAFVIFNHQESATRCVDDYSRTNFLYYPRKLKFGGKRITVVVAPEPDNLIYENMEISSLHKKLMRLISSLAAFVLLIVSFAIVLTAFDYKQKFEETLPDLSLCLTEIPSLYMGGRDNLTEYLEVYGLISLPMVRSDMADRADTDLLCDNALQGSVYAVYSPTLDVNDPAITYDFAACGDDICPDMSHDARCPCISPTDKTLCPDMECIDAQAQDSESCLTFRYSTVAVCYCINRLEREIAENGVLDGVQIMEAEESELCGELLINFTSVNLFRFIAVVLIVVINGLLKYVLRVLAKKEYYNSLDSEMSTTMSKTFIALFINTAIIVLIVFGRPPMGYTIPATLKSLNIFDGVFDDFTIEWYAQVGVQLTMTLIFQAILVAVIPFVKSVFGVPFQHLMAKKNAHFHSASIAMQADLNEYYIGPRFDLALNYSQSLNFLFVCLTFAPGIPFMMPIGLGLFIGLFYANKRLLLRYFRRPEHVASAIQEKVNSILKWVLLFRVGFGIWMFSTPQILASRQLALPESLYAYSPVIARLAQEHVLLNLIFFIGLVVFLTVKMLDKAIPVISTLFKVWKMIMKAIFFILYLPCYLIGKLASKVSPTDGSGAIPECSGFTDDYYTIQTEDSRMQLCKCGKTATSSLTAKQKHQGYTEEYDASGYVIMRRLWMDKGDIFGINYYPGDKMKTWMVIHTGAVCSYTLAKIPTYTVAVKAIKESITNVLIDKALERTRLSRPNHTIMDHVNLYVATMGAGITTGLSPAKTTSKFVDSPTHANAQQVEAPVQEEGNEVEMANRERQEAFGDYANGGGEEQEEEGGYY